MVQVQVVQALLQETTNPTYQSNLFLQDGLGQWQNHNMRTTRTSLEGAEFKAR